MKAFSLPYPTEPVPLLTAKGDKGIELGIVAIELIKTSSDGVHCCGLLRANSDR